MGPGGSFYHPALPHSHTFLQCPYQETLTNLEKHSWEVDYIITHCCPTSVQEKLGAGFYQADALTDFLEEIAQKCQFKYWFFGHYHDNRVIREKFVLLYEQIIRLKL